jgi:cytidyltransferase-like protein
MPRRIALYGGSFDPLHSAHKEIIKHLSKHFDLVILIPTNVTYYKANTPMFTFDDRCKVISNEIAKYDNVVISTIEKNIPENW